MSGDATAEAVLRRIRDEGIETVRVLVPDQHGVLRGKVLTARAVASAFKAGVRLPSTLLLKDTSHRTVFPVWEGGEAAGLPAGAGDVVARPDPGTFRVLPGAPQSGLVLCDLEDRAGAPVAVSSRAVLARAEAALAEAGYRAVFGLEVEFHVYARAQGADDPALAHGAATMPPAPVGTRNLTQGWQFLTETRYGEAEPVLDALRRMAEGLGLAPRTVEVEMGPSQFEFTFEPSGATAQADRYVLFRTFAKELCHARGLHATFMAKPRLANAAASGWHIHQSLVSLVDGENAFVPGAEGELPDVAGAWIAGLLENATASCLLTTPTVNGYKRYAPHQLAPDRIQWGTDNRGAMVRALLSPGDLASRVENRAAESAANPYLALTAQILSGLDGLRRGLRAPPPTETPYDPDAPALPRTLDAAISAFEGSALYRSELGAFVDYLCTIKRAEWGRYLAAVSEWEQAEYFGLL